MVIGIKDIFKLIGIIIISVCAVFVCTLFLNYNIDLQSIENQILSVEIKSLFDALVMSGTVVSAVSGAHHCPRHNQRVKERFDFQGENLVFNALQINIVIQKQRTDKHRAYGNNDNPNQLEYVGDSGERRKRRLFADNLRCDAVLLYQALHRFSPQGAGDIKGSRIFKPAYIKRFLGIWAECVFRFGDRICGSFLPYAYVLFRSE